MQETCCYIKKCRSGKCTCTTAEEKWKYAHLHFHSDLWMMCDVQIIVFFIYMEFSVCAQQEQSFPFLLKMWGTISSFCFLESYWIQSHNAKPVKPVNQRLLTRSTLSPSVYSGSVELLPINIHPHQLHGSSSENSFSASQHKPQTHQMKNSSHEIIAEEGHLVSAKKYSKTLIQCSRSSQKSCHSA